MGQRRSWCRQEGGPGSLRQSAASGGTRLTGSLLAPSSSTRTPLWHLTDARLYNVMAGSNTWPRGLRAVAPAGKRVNSPRHGPS